MRCQVRVYGPDNSDEDCRVLTVLIDGGAEVSVFMADRICIPPSCRVEPTSINLSGAFGSGAAKEGGCGRTVLRLQNDGICYPQAHVFTTHSLKGYAGIFGID